MQKVAHFPGSKVARPVLPFETMMRPRYDVLPHRPPEKSRTRYVIRPYISDPHVEALQHVENRGMYRRELAIERGKFPKLSKVMVVQTDGALNDLEFEFTVPSLIPLFRDRRMIWYETRAAVAKAGRDQKIHFWKSTKVPEKRSLPVVNLTQFPYCIPTTVGYRRPVTPPNSTEYEKYRVLLKEEQGL